ncbi:MAG: hypothetical protein ACTSRE_14040 [Promethearchaeota archaeon]
MHLGDRDSILSKFKDRKARWIPQVINGIISVTLGLTTLQLKRPHKYIDGGIYYFDSGYPFQPPIVNESLLNPLSFIAASSPALSALIITILNSFYLFTGRLNKEIKLWVKFLLIFLSSAWLIFTLIIPKRILPAIEHPLFKNVDSGPSYYGVFCKNREKKN